MSVLLKSLRFADGFLRKLFVSFSNGEPKPTPGWKGWLIYGATLAGACGFVASIGLPVYLAIYTPLAWFDIVICTAGTYWISTMLLNFQTFYGMAEGTLWILWNRVTNKNCYSLNPHADNYCLASLSQVSI
jgi:hypothetical protein